MFFRFCYFIYLFLVVFTHYLSFGMSVLCVYEGTIFSYFSISLCFFRLIVHLLNYWSIFLNIFKFFLSKFNFYNFYLKIINKVWHLSRGKKLSGRPGRKMCNQFFYYYFSSFWLHTVLLSKPVSRCKSVLK